MSEESGPVSSHSPLSISPSSHSLSRPFRSKDPSPSSQSHSISKCTSSHCFRLARSFTAQRKFSSSGKEWLRSIGVSKKVGRPRSLSSSASRRTSSPSPSLALLSTSSESSGLAQPPKHRRKLATEVFETDEDDEEELPARPLKDGSEEEIDQDEAETHRKVVGLGLEGVQDVRDVLLNPRTLPPFPVNWRPRLTVPHPLSAPFSHLFLAHPQWTERMEFIESRPSPLPSPSPSPPNSPRNNDMNESGVVNDDDVVKRVTAATGT